MRTGSQGIRGCARGSRRLQNSSAAFDFALRKRANKGKAAMTGALDRERSSRVTARRAEAVLGAFITAALASNPSAREKSATESVRGRIPTFSPGRQRREEGALLGELREELVRAGQG
jgi:hypothetical protein